MQYLTTESVALQCEWLVGTRMGKRFKQVHLYVSEEEKAAFEAEAGRMGLPISAWVRQALLAKLEDREKAA
jgi:Ribbon-helix-helix protein, copG family